MCHKILSICIPTYMRSTKLKECLDSIIKQFDNDIISKIDIIIFLIIVHLMILLNYVTNI
ncbi:MAG: glycosyltransferase [Clostridium sp.]|nr:MAG: glycosyltransferase [Clostridium sp.]